MTKERGMLWGGRFSSKPHPDMMRLTKSIAVDIRLLEYELEATKAHASALVEAGLLEQTALAQIDDVCGLLLREYRSGTLEIDPDDEDVHSLVERRLSESSGDAGRRIHAGRSRNDLIATDLRLWCRAEAERLAGLCVQAIEGLVEIAEGHVETVMPGYTHLQRGQPVSLAFHLLAHGFSLERDARRFRQAAAAANVSPLGAGALAGTTLGLDANVARKALGFDELFANAMDAVSDRDFACDLVYACALCGVHLSRLAEEIVLWTSSEFGFARVSDEWSTGSSMMPQKRNPDMAELARGRSAGGIADLSGLLTVFKGLPLAYDRDMQEDKEFIFRAVDRVAGVIEGITKLVASLEFDERRMAEAAAGGGGWATDVAEALVGRGVPFRDAHAAVGRLVRELESSGLELAAAPLDLLKGCHEALEADDVVVADPRASLTARTSRGGTAPERVLEQIELLRERASSLQSPT